MIWINFYPILFSIFIAKLNAQFGGNIHRKMVQISIKALDSIKIAKNKEDLLRNIRNLNETFVIEEKGRYIENSFNYLTIKMPGKLDSMRTLNTSIKEINTIYGKFLNLMQKKSDFIQFDNFFENLTKGDAHDLQNLMEVLHEFIINERDTKSGTFSTLQTIFKTDSGACRSPQSPQGTILTLYEMLMLTEMKIYMITQFASAYLNKKKLSELHSRHLNEIDEISLAVKPYLSSASRYLWECDPIDSYIEDVTYSRFTKTFTYMPVRQDEIGGGIKDICKRSCHDTTRGPTSHHNCSGNLNWCDDYGQFLKICHANRRSVRRLMYVKNVDTSMVYGKEVKCKSGNIQFLHSTMVTAGTQCRWCFCACEYARKSHRFISLVPVTSDIFANLVITGLRFRKVKRVLYVQIQQGVLVDEGYIMPHSVQWKDIELVSIRREQYVYSSNYRPARMYSSGKEYFSLDYNRRFLDLDEIYVPPKHVITGVGIIYHENGHIGFQVRATKYQYHGGILALPETSLWIETKMYPNRKFKFSDPDADIPILSKEQSTPIMDRNIFITFSSTSKKKDMGQEIVPFIDLNAVQSFPPTPFVGLAMILKKQNGYGGFIAWRAVANNYYEKAFPEDTP